MDFEVDLVLHFRRLLLLDLSVLKHFLNLMILVHKHEVLSTTQLD